MPALTDYGAHLPSLQIDQVLPALVFGFAQISVMTRRRLTYPRPPLRPVFASGNSCANCESISAATNA
jgi:hypothetical protein